MSETSKNLWIAIITAIIVLILSPALCYFGGWIFGWLTKVTIGSWFVTTVNSVLGTAITAEMLPTLGGILGVITHSFRLNLNAKS